MNPKKAYAILNKMIDQIFKYSIDSIIATDKSGIITQINPAAEEMLGYTKKELLGSHIEILYSNKEDLEKVSKEVKSTGQFKGEIINKTKNNKRINAFLFAHHLLDDNDNIIGMMGISRNINSNISLEKKIKGLTNTVTEIIYTLDENGIITYVNDSVKTILGYEKSELIDKPFKDIIYLPHLKYVNEHHKKHLDKKITESHIEYLIIKKDGTYIWVGVNVSTRFNSINKHLIDGTYGVLREIDKEEEDETEHRITKIEMEYRELFDSSVYLIQSLDINGKIQYVNDSWQKIMGYTREEVYKLDVFSFVNPEDLELAKTRFNNIIQTGELPKMKENYTLYTKKGNKVILEGTSHLKKENGKLVSIQSFFSDVTEQKELEEQLIEKEKTLRQITETLNDVFYLYNVIEKKYDYISPSCESILGANQDFFYDKNNYKDTFVHPDDISLINDALSSINYSKDYNIEYRIIINEQTIWINEKSFPITDENSQIIAHSGICSDITELKNAQRTIDSQNREIKESITYAKRLQESVLPSKETITNTLQESFVMYKPKDKLSGDFFIVDHLSSDEETYLPVFAVGDCTGHGIPGAILSLMCNVLVRESFTHPSVNSGSDALNFIRKRLVKLFNSGNQDIIRDGMDISLCVLEKSKNHMHFTGAIQSCILIRNNKLNEYKGDRQHIGYSDNPVPFKSEHIDIEDGDVIYIYTDGFEDQFGGDKGKKYKSKNFKNFLISIHNNSMEKQKKLLENEFEKWRGDNEQIDDICVMGIKI